MLNERWPNTEPAILLSGPGPGPGPSEKGDPIPKFIFWVKDSLWQIWGSWFQIWQYFLEILAQKYPIKAFLTPELDIFIISRNFANWQIWECWFQIWKYFFEILA